MKNKLFWSLALLSALLAGACTENKTAPRGIATTPPATAPAVSPRPTTPPHPVSLQALMQKRYDGRDLTVGRVLASNSSYTRYFVTYRSGKLRISGIMNVPRGGGPFPVLVYAHGHFDPEIYVNGQGLRREQDYMARRGYVVLHTDYRNHAQSSADPTAERDLRLGYTEDTINAILAIRDAKLPYVDPDRIGLLGRSMGGGVSLNVAVVRPDLVKAIVLFAPVSSDYVDNFDRWIRGNASRRALADRIETAYGSPEKNPEFWENISPVNFFDRIAVPILIHQGTNDERVDPDWTDRTVAALRKAGKTVTYYLYRGEHHEFGPQWPLSMTRTRTFFDRHL
jgi:dipeptidyl aminopeptidase/acylaminoacyl peptidase